MYFVNIPEFIKKYIVKRDKSLFQNDIINNKVALSNNIKDKSILVIGGAGTIGSSFIYEILNFRPRKLIVVDTNENALTELTRNLRSIPNQFIPDIYVTYPMDFGTPIFKKMFLDNSPFDIVANFAAYKHVRSEKDKYSIESMLENNFFKAKSFLDILTKNKPKHFFCVSTDKAANPVNVMGASKKLMEELIMSYSHLFNITTARFANVAFSNGSLLDGYIERLSKNQPISCPEDIKRFFVSPEESGQICMLACILGKSGDIFFPKLNKTDLVNFKNITDDFFKFLSRKIIICESEEEAKEFSINLDANNPYPIYYFKSSTSGEKLFEEFYSINDEIDLNSFVGLGVIRNSSKSSIDKMDKIVKTLTQILNSENYDKSSIINLLKDFLTDFDHIETGKNLDEIM